MEHLADFLEHGEAFASDNVKDGLGDGARAAVKLPLVKGVAPSISNTVLTSRSACSGLPGIVRARALFQFAATTFRMNASSAPV